MTPQGKTLIENDCYMEYLCIEIGNYSLIPGEACTTGHSENLQKFLQPINAYDILLTYLDNTLLLTR